MPSPFFFLAFLLPASALANPLPSNFSVACSTSNTSVSLEVEGTKLHFHLSDGAGSADFPIFSGVVTPAMLPIVERGAKDLAPFDRDVDISWGLSKCSVDAKRPLLMSCDGRGEITEPAGVQVVATSLSTSKSETKNIDFDSHALTVNLGLSTTGDDFAHYYLTFPFEQSHCSAGTLAAKLKVRGEK